MADGELNFRLDADTAGAVRNLGIMGAVGQASVSDIGKATKLGATSFHLFTNAAIMSGNAMAANLAGGAQLAVGSLHAVKAAAASIGMSFGPASLAVVGLVTAFWTMAEAIKAVAAGMEEMESTVKSRESLTANVEKTRELINYQNALGNISPEQNKKLIGLSNQAIDATNLGDGYKWLQQIRSELRSIVGIGDEGAMIKLNESLADLGVKAMPHGLKRDLAEIALQYDKILQNVVTLSNEAGKDPSKAIAAVNAAAEAAKAEAKAKYDIPIPGERLPARPNVTAIERMGGILGSGANEPSRQTSQNTRLILAEAKITNKLLAGQTTTTLVNN